jgi:hypothetical protein
MRGPFAGKEENCCHDKQNLIAQNADGEIAAEAIEGFARSTSAVPVSVASIIAAPARKPVFGRQAALARLLRA